jgi:hypothetical protein
MYVSELICLANSRKRGGRCVAGVRTDGGGWLRPVGTHPEGVLFPWEYRLDDGTEPRVLDIIKVSLLEPRPQPHQPENWLIDGKQWKLVERPASREYLPVLRRAVNRGYLLFGNDGDRVPYNAFASRPAGSSLTLVVPRTFSWQIRTWENGKRQLRALFSLGPVQYNLGVTDPVWEERTKHLPAGTHPFTAAAVGMSGRLLLTISLGEPFNGFCYKLVAAVFVLPQ